MGKFKIDGATNATEALNLAGDVFPAIGDMLQKVSEVMEGINAEKIENKLLQISKLVPDQHRTDVARNVAVKLTVRRRDYLTALTMEDIKRESNQIERVTKVFSDENQYNLKGQIDLKWIEVFILTLNIKEIQGLAMQPSFATDFSSKIVQEFMDEQKAKHLSAELQVGQMPEEFPKKVIPPYYFDKDDFPNSLKKTEDEKAKEHEQRVVKYLHKCSNEKFEQIGTIVDPTKEAEKKFFKIYKEVEALRTMNEAKLKTGGKGCCEIF